MIGRLGVGHIGGALSIVEALTVLYFREMRVRPEDPSWSQRDHFILSKGHGGPGLYAVLAERGFFSLDLLWTLNQPETLLPSHCDRLRTPGIDMTAGSLGQGLSAAIGIAIAKKISGNSSRVFAIIGDGESQEGQIWEAAMLASHRKLDNLIVMQDYNRMQIDGNTSDINGLEPLEDKWRAFGWNVASVDGHNVGEIADAIKKAKEHHGRPSMIVLNTVKGKGAYFAEGKISSHNMEVSEEEWKNAIAELQREGA
ncbi:MAG: transketolase [Kosmotogaceae bacterium]|nr:transketolase [Kosmotogaceae bacterium]